MPYNRDQPIEFPYANSPRKELGDWYYGHDASPNLDGWNFSLTGSEQPEEHVIGIYNRIQKLDSLPLGIPSEAKPRASMAQTTGGGYGYPNLRTALVAYAHNGSLHLGPVFIQSTDLETAFPVDWTEVSCPDGYVNLVVDVMQIYNYMVIAYEGGESPTSRHGYVVYVSIFEYSLITPQGVDVVHNVKLWDESSATIQVTDRNPLIPIRSYTSDVNNFSIGYVRDIGSGWSIDSIGYVYSGWNSIDNIVINNNSLDVATYGVPVSKVGNWASSTFAFKYDGDIKVGAISLAESGAPSVNHSTFPAFEMLHDANYFTDVLELSTFEEGAIHLYLTDRRHSPSASIPHVETVAAPSGRPAAVLLASQGTETQVVLYESGEAIVVGYTVIERPKNYYPGHLWADDRFVIFTESRQLLNNPEEIVPMEASEEDLHSGLLAKYDGNWHLEWFLSGPHRPITEPCLALSAGFGEFDIWTVDGMNYVGRTPDVNITSAFPGIVPEKTYENGLWTFYPYWASQYYKYTFDYSSQTFLLDEVNYESPGGDYEGQKISYARDASLDDSLVRFAGDPEDVLGYSDPVRSVMVVDDGMIIMTDFASGIASDPSWNSVTYFTFYKVQESEYGLDVVEIYAPRSDYYGPFNYGLSCLQKALDGTYYALDGWVGDIWHFDEKFNPIESMNIPPPSYYGEWHGFGIDPKSGDFFLYSYMSLHRYKPDGTHVRDYFWMTEPDWIVYDTGPSGEGPSVADYIIWESYSRTILAPPVFIEPYIYIPATQVNDGHDEGWSNGIVRINIENENWERTPGDNLFARARPTNLSMGHDTPTITLVDLSLQFVASNQALRLPTIFGRPN